MATAHEPGIGPLLDDRAPAARSNLFRLMPSRREDGSHGEKWFHKRRGGATPLFRDVHQRHYVVPTTRRASRSRRFPSNRQPHHLNDVARPPRPPARAGDGANVLPRPAFGPVAPPSTRLLSDALVQEGLGDMMCERALSRESHRQVISDTIWCKEAIRRSYCRYNMLRLLLLCTRGRFDNRAHALSRAPIRGFSFTMPGPAGGFLPGAPHQGIARDHEPHAAPCQAKNKRLRAHSGLPRRAAPDRVHRYRRPQVPHWLPAHGAFAHRLHPPKRPSRVRRNADAFPASPTLERYCRGMHKIPVVAGLNRKSGIRRYRSPGAQGDCATRILGEEGFSPPRVHNPHIGRAEVYP